MKKRLFALLLVLVLLAPTALASAAYYAVDTNWLKVRRLPEANASVLDSYRRDWALTVEKKYGDWAYVTFTNGKDGYVQSKYLKSTKSYTAYITNDGTALRKGPSYTFSKVGTLARGAKVTVLSHGSKYDYISTSVGRGYVKNSFLSKKKVKASGNSSTAESIADPSKNYDAYVVNPNNRTVNLRTGPGTNYRVINAYRPGTGVTVLEAGPDWSHISIEGQEGYMMSMYLSTAKPAAAETPKPAGGNSEPSPTDAPFVPFMAYVTSANGKSVNIHRGPGLGYANVTRAAVGTAVTVLGQVNKTWMKIEIDGKTGYIMKKYLEY